MVTETIMNASPWLLLGLMLLAGLIGWNVIKMNLKTQGKNIAKIATVGLALALALNLGWLAMDTTDTVTVAAPATWDVTPSSATDNTTVAGSTVLTTYTLTGEPAFNAMTGSVTVSFACSRTDTSVADAVATASVVSIPTVTNTTSGVTHDLVTKDSQGVYDADFTVTGVTTPMSATYPSDPSARTATVSLTIVFGVNAIEALDDYGSINIQYLVGGRTITHTIMKLPSS